MIYIIRPSNVLAIEALRRTPFCGMFGCVEQETLARLTLQILEEDSDTWDGKIVESSLWGLPNIEWLLNHNHPDGTKCKFLTDWFDNNHVPTDAFIKRCIRYGDNKELRPSHIKKILPNWPEVYWV